MKSTVRIENVGPIKFAEIDLQKYIVLIGEQASGKSTIAKVVYGLTNVGEIIRRTIFELVIIKNEINSEYIINYLQEEFNNKIISNVKFIDGRIS